jgi:predicted AAA+ superfamily ATPase
MDDLVRWLNRDDRRPLILRGARQVGKSTIVRMLAQEQKLDLFEINLEKHARLDRVFASLDVDAIQRELAAVVGRPIPAEGGLLFLDEVQATPNALAALRYFFEEKPGLPVIAAGSLLEIVLSRQAVTVPVGRVEYHHMGPVNFEEFLEARGEKWLLDQLRAFECGDEWSEVAHKNACKLLRDFMGIGGMPEVTAASLAHPSDPLRWSMVQQRLAEAFKEDFPKYGARKSLIPTLQTVFDRLPRQVGKKIKYSEIDRGERSERIRESVELLSLARIIHCIHHTPADGIPLGGQSDQHVFKSYWLDTGLLNRALGLQMEVQASDSRLVHEGVLAEQFIAQHLVHFAGPHQAPTGHYWLREGKSENAEVDFLIQSGSMVVPIEVKSAKAGALKSLHQFAATHDTSLAIKLSGEMPSLTNVCHDISVGKEIRSVSYRLLTLPSYFVMQIPRIIRGL